MPYIPQMRRVDVEPLLRTPAETPGELNYQVTRLVQRWVDQNGTGYNTFNAAIGVLESAKLELYRRMVGPYEDSKKNENGDVY